MQKLQYHICAAILLMASILQAQYTGGDGDGFHQAVVVQLSLDGVPRGVRALYIGGIGDGVDEEFVSATLSGQPLAAIYVGGRGDGFDNASVNTTLSGQELSLLFFGGDGDGFNEETVSTSLSGQVLTLLYEGGSGDGFNVGTQSSTLGGVELALLYGGGNGDGFDEADGAFSLGGQLLAVLYGGGDGDGFDARSGSFTLSGAELAQLFGGGGGDGFDEEMFSSSVPLPLTLLSLAADLDGENVVVSWTTANEIGTNYFVVERSADAAQFSDLGEVDAIGNGAQLDQTNDYAFIDTDPLLGTSYYRLGIFDNDGSYAPSELVSITREMLSEKTDWSYTLYPNPNTGRELFISPNNLSNDANLEITISDIRGQLIHRQVSNYAGQTDPLRIGLSNQLVDGSYVVRLRSGEESSSKILIVAR